MSSALCCVSGVREREVSISKSCKRSTLLKLTFFRKKNVEFSAILMWRKNGL